MLLRAIHILPLIHHGDVFLSAAKEVIVYNSILSSGKWRLDRKQVDRIVALSIIATILTFFVYLSFDCSLRSVSIFLYYAMYSAL